jgi:hypothetical protein
MGYNPVIHIAVFLLILSATLPPNTIIIQASELAEASLKTYFAPLNCLSGCGGVSYIKQVTAK